MVLDLLSDDMAGCQNDQDLPECDCDVNRQDKLWNLFILDCCCGVYSFNELHLYEYNKKTSFLFCQFVSMCSSDLTVCIMSLATNTIFLEL